jgi:multiple sugar transport system substrate-binding protein
MSKRSITFNVVALLVVGLLVGFASVNNAKAAAQKPLKVYSVWTGGEAKDFQLVLDKFTKKTGIDVKAVGVDTQTLKLSTLADYEAGFTPGDVVVMPWPARIVSDAKAGNLIPVGDLYNPENQNVSNDTVTTGEKTYGAPIKVDIKPGFWYRESFFEKHNLKEPETYDEFLNLLERISKIEGVKAPLTNAAASGWPLTDMVEAFMLRNGASVQRGLISGKVKFDDMTVKGPMKKVLNLIEKGYFGPSRKFGIAYRYMWNGSTPLYFMGSWTPSFVQSSLNEEPTAVDFFRLPGVEGAVGSTNWLTVPKYSDRLKDAKKLVEFLTSAEAQKVWAKEGGFIGTNKNIPAEAYKIPIMKEISDMAGEVTIVPDLDDSLGEPFQSTFWSQLQLLWTSPSQGTLDSVINRLNKAQAKSLEK